MRRLVYRDGARNDLREIAAYIATAAGSRAIAQAFIDKVRAKCRHISGLAGTQGTDPSDLRPGIRSTPFGRYIIVFRYREDTVEIVNVINAGRDVVSYYHDASDQT